MTKTIVAALGLLLAATTAFAQDDPPGRVGRLSHIDGTASFHNGDQDQWSPATLNYPVIAGQSYWTEPQSRVELKVGGVALRLDEASLLDIAALDDRTTRLQLDQGALNLHIAAVPPGGVQVQTPLGWVTIGQPGAYHLDAGHPDGDQPAGFVVVTALAGSAEFDGPGSRIAVLAGESAAIGGNPLTAQLTQAASTPLDDWAAERERRAAAEETRRYVSAQVTGYDNLDDYGRWNRDPNYGAVWYPSAVPSDWQPYHYGHWAWVPPWGWTWVDDAPWGFAPFHYGRWVEVGDRWGWCPGERVERPVYAPALVAFIGGAGFGIAIAAGAPEPAIGWVPLAPNEVYHPYYHASRDYVRNVNVTSVSRTEINNITVTNVTNNVVVNNVTVNHFHNQGAATVMPAAAFTRAAPVQHAALGVPHEELAHAHVAGDLQHLPPTAAARAGVAVPVAATAPRGNAPARLATAPITPVAVPRAGAEPSLPAAPGPKIVPHEQRQSHLPPPSQPLAPATPGNPGAAPGTPHDHRDVHLPPPGSPTPPTAPAATVPVKPQDHRDARLPPPGPPTPPAAPATTVPVKPQDHRDSRLPPPGPPTPSAPPVTAVPVKPQDHRDAHLPPPGPPSPPAAPVTTAPVKPQDHRDTRLPPPPNQPPSHPAATMNAPPPAAVIPPKLPPPPPAAIVTPPKPPPPPPAALPPKPPQPAPANVPPHGGPPPKDKDKDKKDAAKPNG